MTTSASQPGSTGVPWAASGPAGAAPRSGGGAGASLWARQSRTSTERVTARVRRQVHGLPDWEPLPPGESVVRRPGL